MITDVVRGDVDEILGQHLDNARRGGRAQMLADFMQDVRGRGQHKPGHVGPVMRNLRVHVFGHAAGKRILARIRW